MRKVLAIILALAMVFCLFAGCGKDSSNNTSNGGTSSGATNSGNSGNGNNNTGVETNAATGANINTIDRDSVHPSDTATFRFAGQAAPTAMSIQGNSGAAASAKVTELFYDTLFVWDSATNTAVPNLATSYTWLDNLTLRITLREDVKSILGDPMTASDVLFSFAFGAETAKLNTYYANTFDVSKFNIVDDYTIDLVLKAGEPFLVEKLTCLQYPIMVEASVEKLGGKDQVTFDPSAGTGAYKLTKWDETDNVVYAERNEDYWGTLPYYKYYEYHVVTDATSRAMGVEAGDYDACYQPNSTDVIAANGNKDLACYFDHSSSMIRWDINSERDPFNVKEVRQALALLVNYDAIAQVCYNGYCDTVDSPYAAVTSWHTSPDEGDEFYFEYNPERAKQLLIDAGYADGFDMHIMCVSGRSYISSSLEIIQNSLKQVGINVIIDQYESATYGSFFTVGDYDSVLNNASAPVPSNYLKCVNPNLSYSEGSTCGIRWCEDIKDEVVDLIDKCTNTTDTELLYDYLDKFQDLLREYVPFIPVATPYVFNISRSTIANISLDINGQPMITNFYPADYLG